MQLPHSARRGIPHRLAFVLTSLLLPLFAASCGSGGGPPATSGRITATIDWPARSRAIDATASALSLRITIPKGNLDGSDCVWNIDRDNNPQAHVMAVTSPSPVRFGSYVVTIDGLSLPGAGAGSGNEAEIASGSASAVLGPGHASLPPISLASQVADVAVATTTASLSQASPAPFSAVLLQFLCTDAAGNTLVLTPGSAVWKLTSSTGFVTLAPDGVLQFGYVPFTATVTVTVDGVTSAPATIDSPYDPNPVP